MNSLFPFVFIVTMWVLNGENVEMSCTCNNLQMLDLCYRKERLRFTCLNRGHLFKSNYFVFEVVFVKRGAHLLYITLQSSEFS